MSCRLPFTVTALAFLAACQTGPQSLPKYDVSASFDEQADFAWALDEGDAEINGEAFMKTRGGDVKTCAGNAVTLVPANTYTSEMAAHLSEMGVKYSGFDTDPRYQKYRREKTCRADGSFTFDDLPAGDWYLSAIVFWEAPSQYGLQAQGGTLYREIEVSADETREVVLTGDDLAR